jgi:hypothetical protein
MSVNLHLLRMFATVVRSGSFSKAAEILNISQRGLDGARSVAACRGLFAVERAAEEEFSALPGLHNGSGNFPEERLDQAANV